MIKVSWALAGAFFEQLDYKGRLFRGKMKIRRNDEGDGEQASRSISGVARL